MRPRPVLELMYGRARGGRVSGIFRKAPPGLPYRARRKGQSAQHHRQVTYSWTPACYVDEARARPAGRGHDLPAELIGFDGRCDPL